MFPTNHHNTYPMIKEYSITITSQVEPSKHTATGFRVTGTDITCEPEDLFIQNGELSVMGVQLMAGLISQGLSVIVKAGESIGLSRPQDRAAVLKKILDHTKTNMLMSEGVSTFRKD